MYLGNKTQKHTAVILFLLPSVCCLLIFFIVPIFTSFGISLTNWDPLKPLSQIKFIGFANFKDLFTRQSKLFDWFSHTAYYMVLYIPLVLLTALGEALILNKEFKGLRLYKVMFYFPVITSWVAGAVIWKWILNAKYGFLNNWLAVIGIQGPNWLSNRMWAMPGIVVAAIWKDTGYYALIFLAALKGINKTYYEVAKVDGASNWKKFTRITLPLITPTIFMLVVINIINGFQVFESVFVMTGGGPAESTTVVVERIYANAFNFFKMGYASAISWILFAFIFVATAIQFKIQNRWVNYDA